MARVSDRVLRARLRRQHLPEPVRSAARGHHEREEGDRGQGEAGRVAREGHRGEGQGNPEAGGRDHQRAGGVGEVITTECTESTEKCGEIETTNCTNRHESGTALISYSCSFVQFVAKPLSVFSVLS